MGTEDDVNLSAPLLVEVDVEDGAATITVEGEMDAHTCELLDGEIPEVLATGASELTLDVSGVSFVDSSGLRVLIRAHEQARAHGGQVSLRGPDATFRRLLEVTGLDGVFPVV
ncbi:MAG: STAS domain-containing protein [Acidimicrobiia bacterium]|nr:STAS domain-containing protein [Acidimicrobiia bacterium]